MRIDRIPLQCVHSSSVIVQWDSEAPPLHFHVSGDAALVNPLMGVVDEAVLCEAECHVGDAGLFVWNAYGGVPAY